jgi:hypothetical protein
MPHAFLLQEWTTIQGAASDSVTQSEEDWLDLEEFADVTFYLVTRSVSAVGPGMHYETSPSKDSDLFGDLTGGSFTLSPSMAVSSTNGTLAVKFAASANPLARWVRWRLFSTSAWNATFRIWVVANAHGFVSGGGVRNMAGSVRGLRGR